MTLSSCITRHFPSPHICSPVPPRKLPSQTSALLVTMGVQGQIYFKDIELGFGGVVGDGSFLGGSGWQSKVYGYSSSQSNLPHFYGNSRAV